MADISWLADEAKNIHAIFSSLFYLLVTVFLLLGVLVEYFKWPLGSQPVFSVLIGRALVAAILLNCYPEVTNALADVADALAKRMGDLNQVKLVLARMGERLHELTWSWLSIKEYSTMAVSFLAFFLLYFSVYVTEAFMLYTWTVLYIFSPVLIALFTLPATAGATKALYRSLIEVSCWKIVWSVLATLLWSAALSNINKPGHDVNYITVICLDLILAGSLLLTPFIVHALAEKGMSGLTGTVGSIAVGALVISPSTLKKIFLSMTGMGKKITKGLGKRIGNSFLNKSRRTMMPRRPRGQKNTPEQPPTENENISPETENQEEPNS